MKAIWKKLPAAATLAAAAVLGLGSTAAQAQGKTITLCWAAWDPANALKLYDRVFAAYPDSALEPRLVSVLLQPLPQLQPADRYIYRL